MVFVLLLLFFVHFIFYLIKLKKCKKFNINNPIVNILMIKSSIMLKKKRRYECSLNFICSRSTVKSNCGLKYWKYETQFGHVVVKDRDN